MGPESLPAPSLDSPRYAVGVDPHRRSPGQGRGHEGHRVGLSGRRSAKNRTGPRCGGTDHQSNRAGWRGRVLDTKARNVV